MSLEETLEQHLKEAMKEKNPIKTSTLRLVKAAMMNCRIDKKNDTLEDGEVVQILQKQAKQRKESMESFQKAGRSDLLEKEKAELSILESYLPKPLTDDEIKKLAETAIRETQAATKADIGKVMKALMPHVRGRADGKQVQKTVESLLSKQSKTF